MRRHRFTRLLIILCLSCNFRLWGSVCMPCYFSNQSACVALFIVQRIFSCTSSMFSLHPDPREYHFTDQEKGVSRSGLPWSYSLNSGRSWTLKSLTLKPLDFTSWLWFYMSPKISKEPKLFSKKRAAPLALRDPLYYFWPHSVSLPSAGGTVKCFSGTFTMGTSVTLLVSGRLRVFMWLVALFLISCVSLTLNSHLTSLTLNFPICEMVMTKCHGGCDEQTK